MDKNLTIDEGRRLEALTLAIEAKCATSYDADGNQIFDHNKVVNAAKAFEEYLKGE